MAVTNASVVDITANTLLSQSKPGIISNFDDLLENDVDIEARVTTNEGDIATLTSDKAPLANPTFTGTVKTPKGGWTEEGGIAISLLNKTGVASVKGTIGRASTGTDNAFAVAGASSNAPMCIVYENAKADAAACLVVTNGIAEVLLKDGTACTRGDWAGVSDVAGRAYVATEPAAAATHDLEIGHFLESKGAGTDVLAKICVHFR